MYSLGIIGGGRGGLALLNLVENLPDVELKWVVDIQEHAPAIRRARELGIKTSADFAPLVGDYDLDMVIEVTGSDQVNALLEESKHPGLTVVNALAARMVVDIIDQRESMVKHLHEQAQNLVDSADNLSKNIERNRQNMKHLTREAERMAQTGEELSSTAGEAARAGGDIQNILRIIQDMAKKINIIGLNASIEAARAGDVGRGFAVVAEEIRTLSENSSASVKQISGIIDKMVLLLDTIGRSIKNAGDTARGQASVSGEVLVNLEELSAIAGSLEKMSHELLLYT